MDVELMPTLGRHLYQEKVWLEASIGSAPHGFPLHLEGLSQELFE